MTTVVELFANRWVRRCSFARPIITCVRPIVRTAVFSATLGFALSAGGAHGAVPQQVPSDTKATPPPSVEANASSSHEANASSSHESIVLTTDGVDEANGETESSATDALDTVDTDSEKAVDLRITVESVGSLIEALIKSSADAKKASELPSAEQQSTTDGIPVWVDALPQQDELVYQAIKLIGPFDDDDQRDSQTDAALREALQEFEAWTNARTAPQAKYKLPYRVLSSKLRECVVSTYDTQSPSDNLPVRFVLIEFDESFQRDYRLHLADCNSLSRSASIGVWYAALLSLIGTGFGVLKCDQWSQGRFRRALGVGAIGILATVGLVVATALAYLHGYI